MSAAEDAALIKSDEEIPLHLEDPIKLREEEKKKLYRIQMQIKESQCPRGHYVCPDVDCQYTSSREERIPKHVISQHSKQGLFVEKAKEDLQRIKLEQESAQRNKKANIIKLEQEVKEEKIKKRK